MIALGDLAFVLGLNLLPQAVGAHFDQGRAA